MGWQVDSRGRLLREQLGGCWQPGSPPVSPVRSCAEGAKPHVKTSSSMLCKEHGKKRSPGDLVSRNGNGPAVADGNPSPPAAGVAGPRAADEPRGARYRVSHEGQSHIKHR